MLACQLRTDFHRAKSGGSQAKASESGYDCPPIPGLLASNHRGGVPGRLQYELWARSPHKRQDRPASVMRPDLAGRKCSNTLAAMLMTWNSHGRVFIHLRIAGTNDSDPVITAKQAWASCRHITQAADLYQVASFRGDEQHFLSMDGQ